MDVARGAVHEGANALDVRVAPLAGDVVGVADLSTGLRPFAANLTSRGGHHTLSVFVGQFLQPCVETAE
ncbi:MAG: hypothetical protein H6Q86_3027 [candidate division NC10 bacterium]|nr:hypothetical protein [candidate division NC10 bacterium]